MLIEVGVLGGELEVVVSAILLTNLEGIKGVALELSLAVEVHVLERHCAGESHCARAPVCNFLHACQLCLLPFVLRSLHLLVLLEHGNFIIGIVSVS